jgi:hypothetical protein
VQYGFGWFLDPYQGHKRSYHDGETIGFRSTIQRFAEGQWTIVVLSNRNDLDPDALSLKVGRSCFAGEVLTATKGKWRITICCDSGLRP